MLSTVYVVTDLGWGDGGKGSVVHKLANVKRSKAILKFGGGQGSHGVTALDGRKFNFSQFGCGTLEGIPTVISPSFVLIPHAILNEGEMLEEEMGVKNPYSLLTVDPNVLCATPYHRLLSHLYELARKDNPRGTVGTGAGVAYRLREKYGDQLSLTLLDFLKPPVLKEKLSNLRSYCFGVFGKYSASDFTLEDRNLFAEEVELLFDDGFFKWILLEYDRLLSSGIRLMTFDRALGVFDGGSAVAECSHGVLTDNKVGFRPPNVSAIRTLPCFVRETIRTAGFTGNFVNLGVTRAYGIRHGAGDFPTEYTDSSDFDFDKYLLPGSTKDDNRWQGKPRFGSLDFKLLRYAVNVCGGRENFAGVCLTWFDQIRRIGYWRIGDKTYPLPTSPEEQIALIKRLFLRNLGLPVRMISFGPSDNDKMIFEEEES